MTKYYQETITGGIVDHDPAGEDVQIHELGDEVYATFSEDFSNSQGWQVGDAIIWELSDDGRIGIINPQADVRRRVRETVKDHLVGQAWLQHLRAV